MRNTQRCPKCDHGEVIHLPDPTDADGERVTLLGTFGVGGIEAYVCPVCGFTELYVCAPRAIDVSKIAGARLLGAAPGGPFR